MLFLILVYMVYVFLKNVPNILCSHVLRLMETEFGKEMYYVCLPGFPGRFLFFFNMVEVVEPSPPFSTGGGLPVED